MAGFNSIFAVSSIDAAKKCVFEPALQRDKPVKVWVSYPVRFMLKDAK